MVQYLISGIVVGCIFAIAASALVVTYRASSILNLGFGGVAFGAARLYYSLHTEHQWSIWVAALVSIGLFGPLLGGFLYVVLLRFLANSSTLIKVIVTIGIGVTVPALMTLFLGEIGQVIAPGLAPEPVATFRVLGLAITLDQAIVMAALVAILLAGFLILRYTDVGLVIRATVDSPAMTSLIGSNPSVVAFSVWVVTTGIAGLVGVLIAPIIGLSPDNYEILAAGAFSAVLIAKLVYVGRAVAVSLALGVVNALAQYWLPPTSAVTSGTIAAIPFAFVLAFLLWEARRGQVSTPSVLTGMLDRAIAPAKDSGQSGSAGLTHALRLHYAPPGSRTLLNGRTIRAGVVLAVIAILPLFLSDFWTGQFALGLAFGVVLLSFTLVIGEGGMVWLCQVAFAGIAAMMTAFLVGTYNVPVLLAIPLCALMVVPAGFLIALLTTRLGQLQVVLATLAFGVLVDNLILTQPAFQGVANVGNVVSPPSFLSSSQALFYFLLAVFVAVALLVEHYRRSTAGLSIAAVRWSQRAAASVGVSATSMQVVVGTLGAFIAGLGGGLLSMTFGNATPGTFNSSGGLVWLAVLVTIGVRSNIAAAVAGMNFTVAPALVQTYLPLSLSNLPNAMFGLGAIFIATNPDGVVATHARQFSWIGVHVRSLYYRVRGERQAEAPEAPAQSRPVPSRPPVSTAAPAHRAAPATPGVPLLRAQDVSVRFGGVLALKDVTVAVPEGRIVGLVGPNGAGKSTLFGVLSGLLRPQTGNVELEGQDITALPPHRRARLGVARSFQQPELFDSLTVAEHMILGIRMGQNPQRAAADLVGVAGWKRQSPEETQRVESLLEGLGLSEMTNRPCVALPAGASRLVEVGRALAMRPRVVLLDEPAAGLDETETEELQGALARAAQEERVAFLVVEHDLEFVMGLCEMVYVIDFGSIIASGSPAEVRSSRLVHEAYLGAEFAVEA
ncbi:MAG TPA: ATP-binding cassette domain-containing protein [Candidatus Dormibacteraeota bacterium]|nr:ATP-binding cassette domain-containing protein [Candidatus Dormibacteraeota bacterium]